MIVESMNRNDLPSCTARFIKAFFRQRTGCRGGLGDSGDGDNDRVRVRPTGDLPKLGSG
jgi:hypothetical protein